MPLVIGESRRGQSCYGPMVAGVVLLLWAVNATAQCSATTLGVAFGTVDPFSGSAVDSTGSVTVNCLVSVGYSVSLSTGASNSYSPRTLVDGAKKLNYNLFLNAARSTIWGNGSSGTSTLSSSIGLLLLPNTHTIYGRIPGGQNPASGGYADTVTVTVTF
jgi:spore coat protein U-like protein